MRLRNGNNNGSATSQSWPAGQAWERYPGMTQVLTNPPPRFSGCNGCSSVGLYPGGMSDASLELTANPPGFDWATPLSWAVLAGVVGIVGWGAWQTLKGK